MNKLLIPLIILVALVLFNSMYVVQEPHQVIITQFGKPTGDPVLTPGLNFKLPFIQKVHRFEKRFLEWDGDPNQLPTKDKRFIWVNNYARWRITSRPDSMSSMVTSSSESTSVAMGSRFVLRTTSTRS
jgi:membrane protease subunit HflC